MVPQQLVTIWKHKATDYAIMTTKAVFLNFAYLSIYLPSILSFIYLLPYSKNDLDALQIYTTIRDIKTKFKSKDNESKGRLG